MYKSPSAVSSSPPKYFDGTARGSPPRSHAKPRLFASSPSAMLSATGAGDVFAGSNGAFLVSSSPAATIIQKIERDRASYSVSRDVESRIRQELEDSKLALFRRSHLNEETSQRELETLRMQYDATLQEKEWQWQKKCTDMETECKLKMVKLSEETYAQIQALQNRSEEEKQAIMQVSQARIEAEEDAQAELEKKLKKAEKQFASVIRINAEREGEYRTSLDELRREMAAAQTAFEEKETIYKEEIEKREQQVLAVEEMGKEREKWRETVFDKRVKEAVKPCTEQMAVMEAQIQELRAERDALKQTEENDHIKIDTLRGEITALTTHRRQLEKEISETLSRLSVEEALRGEGEKALLKCEESLKTQERVLTERTVEWREKSELLTKELNSLQAQYDLAEVHYKEELEKRDAQLVTVEEISKEREKWRETVFDRRIDETLKPYKDRQSSLETLVQDLTLEKETWKNQEESYRDKVATLQSDLDVHQERETSLHRLVRSMEISLDETKKELVGVQNTLRLRLNDLQTNVEATRQQESMFVHKEKEWMEDSRAMKQAIEVMKEDRAELRLNLSSANQELTHLQAIFAVRDTLATDLQLKLNTLSEQSRTAVDEMLRSHMAAESSSRLTIEELTHRVKEAESITKNTIESAHREFAHAAEMAESREKALTSELQLASQSLQQAKGHQQQLEISLNKSQRSLEQLQLSFQAEEVLYNEKILDAVHEVSHMKEQLSGLSHWKQTAYSLAMACIQTCAGALTIPDFQISSDGMSRLNEYTRNRADILHALTRPQDVVEFLRMNSLRGNVLVNKDLLTHVLQQSKTVIERFKGALMLT